MTSVRRSEQSARRGPKVVALGGGHGLSASLSALRRVTGELTAVVTVADDGGSSGRLRRELGVLPPGDLRMALAALCGDDEWGSTWSEVVQHRFRSEGDLHGHAVGNLLIVALWELLGDPVAGLDWVGRLLGAHGRVLPMASVPLDIVAEVGADPDGRRVTHGARPGGRARSPRARCRSISLVPADPPACPRRSQAVAGRRLGGVRARAPGSPACSRTCWCPSWPGRCTAPGRAGWSRSTWRRSRGRPTASPRSSTWRCCGSTPLTCASTWCSPTPGWSTTRRAGEGRCRRSARGSSWPTWPPTTARRGMIQTSCLRPGRDFPREALIWSARRKVRETAVRADVCMGEDDAHGDDGSGEGRAEPAAGHRSPAAARRRSRRCCGSPAACTWSAGGS